MSSSCAEGFTTLTLYLQDSEVIITITIDLSAIGSTGKIGRRDERIHQLHEGIGWKSQLDWKKIVEYSTCY